MRSRSRIAAWVVGLTVTAVMATLGCGGGGGEDSGIQLNSVAFGPPEARLGAFVAVGDSDRLFVNVGNGWTPYVSGLANLNSVTWSQPLQTFVAVGDGGTIAKIVVTIDENGAEKVAIEPQGSPTTFDLFGVAAGDAGLIAVGAAGTILASTDGVTWVARDSDTGAALNAVAFSTSGDVVAVGANATVTISEDAGLSWSLVQFPDREDVTIGNLNGVTHGSSGWVVVGEGGVVLQAEKPDEWILRGYEILPNLYGVGFVQGLYTVLGEKGRILTSPDGITYSQSVSNSGQTLHATAYGNATYYVVGRGGRALQSLDGVIYQDTKI